MKHKFDYRWKLADANFTKDKGTVFSCFACGGAVRWVTNLRALMLSDAMR